MDGLGRHETAGIDRLIGVDTVNTPSGYDCEEILIISFDKIDRRNSGSRWIVENRERGQKGTTHRSVLALWKTLFYPVQGVEFINTDVAEYHVDMCMTTFTVFESKRVLFAFRLVTHLTIQGLPSHSMNAVTTGTSIWVGLPCRFNRVRYLLYLRRTR